MNGPFIPDDIFRFQPPQTYENALTDGASIWCDEGEILKIRWALTFMDAYGQLTRVVVLADAQDSESYSYSNGKLQAWTDYRLIAIERMTDKDFGRSLMNGLGAAEANVRPVDGAFRHAPIAEPAKQLRAL